MRNNQEHLNRMGLAFTEAFQRCVMAGKNPGRVGHQILTTAAEVNQQRTRANHRRAMAQQRDNMEGVR